jgi:TPP-dependent pyruvate/acetoin dehydrogenase alpha subunit
MNFAAIHKLAVVFCIENNLYTQSVPLRLESSVSDLSSRAAGYGMPGVSIDGMDLGAVYSAAKAAVDRARAGDGPSLIEARTYRYMPNTSNDDDTRYRERTEVEHWRTRDPIAMVRAQLDATTAAEIEQHIATRCPAAAWAEAEPDAPPLAALSSPAEGDVRLPPGRPGKPVVAQLKARMRVAENASAVRRSSLAPNGLEAWR